MKSFLAVIIFLLLVIKVIEGLPLSQFQDDSQSLKRRADSIGESRSSPLPNKRKLANLRNGVIGDSREMTPTEP